MENVGELEDDEEFLHRINFNDLLDNGDFYNDSCDFDFLLEDFDFQPEPCVENPIPNIQTPSPPTETPFGTFEPNPSSTGSTSSLVGAIEEMLMKEDEENPNQDYSLDFFSDLLFDAPIDQSEEEIGVLNPDDSKLEGNDEIYVSDNQSEEIRVLNGSPDSNISDEIRVLRSPDSNVSDDSQGKEGNDEKNEENGDDPMSKKRKRQLRNRDAAVRSRERKKFYVRDLEMKSRYLEGECIRLQRLLHCCYAENHNLHLQLQMGKTVVHDASRSKQESAVLLMESLLLGSLLWFLGNIMGLFLLLPLLQTILPAAMLAKAGSINNQESVERVAPRRTRSEKTMGIGALRMFYKRKRWKATRSKMKIMSFLRLVLA